MIDAYLHAASVVAGPTDYAALAVAAGPPTLAPPTFNGHGWLFVLNLFEMTAGTALAGMLLVKLAIDSWVCWRKGIDAARSPIMLFRRIGMLISFGLLLRCGAEAFSLWSWNPDDPVGSAAALSIKRMIDPVQLIVAGIMAAHFYLLLPGLTEQLRKEPFPIRMMTELRLLRRPACVVALCFIAATAVVVFR